MRQNIGLFCLTAGSILLSINVFWGKYFRSWEELPWEQRFFYKLTGGRKLFDFEAQAKAYETVARMQKDMEFRKRMDNRAKWRSRIVGDLPILAILLMVIGFFLSLNYKWGTMTNNSVNIILWVLGVGFGGLITYGVSRRYYVKATKDLKLMTSALAHYVEGKLDGRDLKFEYNDKGEPINVVYGKGSIHIESNVTGSGQVIK